MIGVVDESLQGYFKAVGLFAAALVVVYVSVRPHSPKPRSLKDSARDEEVRLRASRAAAERQEAASARDKEQKAQWRASRAEEARKKHKEMVQRKDLPNATTKAEIYCQPVSPEPPRKLEGTTTQPVNTAHVGPIYECGYTRFYHMPNLPHADRSKELLLRIAREFEPILSRRGYCVYTVSEMCCCGDGLDTGEIGGQHRRVQANAKINGSDQERCLGYNRTTSGRRATKHSIHLRMRHPRNHLLFQSYAELVNTMCHELAHCEQQNHSDAFYKLMDEIKEEYKCLMSGERSAEFGAQSSSGGFDIYQASFGSARFG